MSSIRQQLYIKAKEIALTKGWSDCLYHAAAELGAPSDDVSLHFPNGSYDIIRGLMKEWNEEMITKIPKKDRLSHNGLIEVGTQRLSSVIPYANHWSEAMCIGAKPKNIFSTTETLWSTFDLILNHAGDQYDPFTYHVKRSSIGSLFIAIETLIAKYPERSQDSLKYFAVGVNQLHKATNTLIGFYDINKFIIDANISILCSFIPASHTPLNPIVKDKENKNS